MTTNNLRHNYMLEYSISAIASGVFIYAAAYFGVRISQFGPSLSLMTAAIGCSAAALIVGIIVLKSMSVKLRLVPVVAILMATMLAESYSGLQEMAVVHQYGKACETGVYVSRWAPFSNHSIYCGKGGKWVGND